jgi:D-aspartate ligase
MSMVKFRRSHIALVLGLFDTGLGAVRSLAREGICVLGFDADPSMPGFKSRFCRGKVCPDPVHKPDELVQFLVKEGKQFESPGILFPATDVFVLFVSRYRDDLSPHLHFVLPSANVLEAIVDKRQQYNLAEKVGTPYPATWYPETLEEVECIKRVMDYPVFIKPCIGHLWRGKFGGIHKGFKVHTPRELIARFEEILPTGLQVMVQSIILGPNTNHFKVNVYIGENGEPLALLTLRKIRQFPTEFGVGTLVESIHYPELVELGLKFFKGIGYRGIGSIEFKKDERDGKLKMIELNPRLWQQNGLATACGINFPLIQYLDLTGQSREPQADFPDGVKWLDGIADFQAFWDYHKRGELSFWKWISSWKGTRAFSSFAWDDLGPFFKNNQYGLKYLRAPLYAMRHRS